MDDRGWRADAPSGDQTSNPSPRMNADERGLDGKTSPQMNKEEHKKGSKKNRPEKTEQVS